MRIIAAPMHQSGRVGWLALVMFGAAVAIAAALYVRAEIIKPVNTTGATVRIEIPTGASLTAVAGGLARSAGLANPRAFTWYARVRGQAARIRAGEYDLPAGASFDDTLALLTSGDVVLHSVTLIEGWTFGELKSALEEHPAIDNTLAGASSAEVMQALGHPGEHPEGRFFPETYRFPKGASDLQILREAYDAMATRLDAAWQERAANLPLASAYEALILASIVEKETGVDDERPQVAGVFVRRLESGMRLQTDPTVIYGMGDAFNGNIRRRDLTRDTPYNTYTRTGLPPTPIAMPGAASLLAAVNPEDGEALYFVATGNGDGRHYFSATLAEHNKAVRRYLQRTRAKP